MGRRLVRQLLVVMFLFYSGYGVTESIASKGKTYINAIPKKRILTTLLNFSVAVCVFIGLASALGKDLTVEQCLLSLIGWESVGNSNWYIFCILICYAATYIAFKASTNSRGALILLSLLSCTYLLVIQHFRGGDIGSIPFLRILQVSHFRSIKIKSQHYLNINIGYA